MRRKMWWIVMMGLAACGTEPSPVEKCDDLVDVLCDRWVQCLGGLPHYECVQAVNTELSCGAAKQVSVTYDRCVVQLQGASCNVLFGTNPSTGQAEIRLPADCNSVILSLDPLSTSPLTGAPVIAGP